MRGFEDMDYNFQEIEKKWQNYWDENETYKTSDDFSKKKFYRHLTSDRLTRKENSVSLKIYLINIPD